MASEKNVKIVGRDRNGIPRQALVDETSAIVCSNNNVGIEFEMTFISAVTGSHLILTTSNETLLYTTSGLVPSWGVARSMWVVTDTVGLNSLIKCYGVDLNNNELIFYLTLNGTTNVTTGNTGVGGIGGVSVNLNTDLRHINRIEDVTPRTGGIVYVRCLVGAVTLTLLYAGHYYQVNPIYLAPNGRRMKFKGFNKIDTNAQNDYGFVVFRKPGNTTISGVQPIAFPFRFRINSTATNANSYQWSETGLVTVNEGEWLFLNREGAVAQTTCGLIALCVEYKI